MHGKDFCERKQEGNCWLLSPCNLLFFTLICTKNYLHNNNLHTAQGCLFLQNCCWRHQNHKGDKRGQNITRIIKSGTHTHTGWTTVSRLHHALHQMSIIGASGWGEAGERSPPTQSRGLCCVANRTEIEQDREGGRDVKRNVRVVITEVSAWKGQVLLLSLLFLSHMVSSQNFKKWVSDMAIISFNADIILSFFVWFSKWENLK